MCSRALFTAELPNAPGLRQGTGRTPTATAPPRSAARPTTPAAIELPVPV